MTDEINFCPFCSAAQHKIAAVAEGLMFCRECNRFFKLEHVMLPCPKCNSKRIKDSEFPSPDGQLVFQCQSCKRMFPAKNFFNKG
ncbi:MAG: hypothetical protein ABIF10_03255 [Candidatus Woesearchaeota archaeon]